MILTLTASLPESSLDVSCVYMSDLQPQIGSHLGEKPAGPAIQVVPSHNVVATADRSQDSRQSSHAADKGKGAGSSLQVSYLGLQLGSGRIAAPRVVILPTVCG